LRHKARATRLPRSRETNLCGVFGTKRLVEIQCPSDCPCWQARANNPPRRRRAAAGSATWDYHALHARLQRPAVAADFSLVTTFLVRYEAPELQRPADEDVVEAMGGTRLHLRNRVARVIYEHRPASLAASHLMSALKLVLGGGRSWRRHAIRARTPSSYCAAWPIPSWEPAPRSLTAPGHFSIYLAA